MSVGWLLLDEICTGPKDDDLLVYEFESILLPFVCFSSLLFAGIDLNPSNSSGYMLNHCI